MIVTPAHDAIDTARTSCVLAILPVAAWEIFLRVDSQVMTTTTKLWFLPLLALILISGSALFGIVVERIVIALVPGTVSRYLLAIVVSAYAATVFAAEYAGLTYYHIPELLYLWPLAASVGAGWGLLVYLVTSSLAFPTGGLPAPRLQNWGVASLAFFTLVTMALLVPQRPDLTEVILRRNSIIGRIGGSILCRFKPSLKPPHSGIVRLPDRPSQRTFPSANVILISIDTLRTDAISPYNTNIDVTPNIQELADHSVVFADAFASRPTSAPSVASLLTSLYPANHSVWGNGTMLPEHIPSLATLLSRHGYRTGAFVSNVNFSEPFGFAQGFTDFTYFEPQPDSDGLLLDSADPQVIDAALGWARQHRHERLFLWAHLISPHSPYLPPPDLQSAARPGDADWFNVLNMPAILARVEGKQTYFDRNTYRTLYMSEVMNIDRLVGRLMSGLAALHLVEDSHIIFVSDHGEAFGEADVFGHGHSLHPVESRVAFFWSLPGYYRGGALIAQTVQLVDFLPTLWNLFGYTQLANLDGRDLSAVLVGEMAEDDGFAFTEAGFIGSLGRQGLKYAARTRQRAVWLDAGLPYDIEFNRLLDPWENRRHRYAPAAEDALFNSLTSLAQQAEGARLRRTKRVRLNDTQKDQLRALGYMQ